MADRFLQLPPDERREAFVVAAAASGWPLHFLDKDVWMVWILEVLFQAPIANHLVFKGGSSLSKAHKIIRRFSEDVDLTYDIRALAPDMVGGDAEPLPPNRSQQKRWTKEIRTRLPFGSTTRSCPGFGARCRNKDCRRGSRRTTKKYSLSMNRLRKDQETEVSAYECEIFKTDETWDWAVKEYRLDSFRERVAVGNNSLGYMMWLVEDGETLRCFLHGQERSPADKIHGCALEVYPITPGERAGDAVRRWNERILAV